jgi:hypothetical protein
MKRTTRVIAGLLACLMVVAALPAVAQTDAEPVPSSERIEQAIERMRDRLLEALDRRLDRIDRLQFEIKESETIEPEHAAHLTADLSASQGGLTALVAKTESADTVEELGAIFDEMVYEHRIFALRTPQTWLVLASDFGVGVAGRLESVAQTLDDAAARAAEAGYDVSEVESLVDEAQGWTAEGLALVDPVAETVLPLEPEDVPDPARAVMEGARDDMFDGREAFRSARDALRQAAELLADILGADAA